MAIIQGTLGASLVDIYDTVGQRLAGITQLRAEEIALVHEMGALGFSEALSGQILRLTASGISQSSNFHAQTSGESTPRTPWRIYAAQLFNSSGAADVTKLAWGIRDRRTGREMTIGAWQTGGTTIGIFRDNGSGTPASILQFVPSYNTRVASLLGMPSVQNPANLPVSTTDLWIGGTTTAFGAGTTDLSVEVLVASADVPGSLRSAGLALPGW